MSPCRESISFYPILRIAPTDTVFFDGKEFLIENVRHDISEDGLHVRITDPATLRGQTVPIRSLAVWKTNRFVPIDTVHSQADMAPIPLRTRSGLKRKSTGDASILSRSTATHCSPSSVVSACVSSVNVSDKSYKQRKWRQNDELIDDTFTYIRQTQAGSLGSIKVLALDDFSDFYDGKKRLSTLCSYMMHGGRKSNFYVINPKPDIFREVYKRGGYGIPLMVRDALEKPYIRFPRFDVIYLDYTSKFKKIEPDLALLMQRNDQLLKSKSVVHLTVSKRGVRRQDYQKEISGYVEKIRDYADAHGILVDVIRHYDSPKMFKIDLFLQRKRRSAHS